MSDTSTSLERAAVRRLPGWLRPRAVELPGSGRMRLVETTLLVLAAILLTTATVNDLVRQNTGHDYHNLSVDQMLLGENSQREVICGNTSPGAPKERTQLCLAIWGPVRDGRRVVHGGWYLPAKVEDVRADRYACFGPASEGLCPR
jgi:hypothetical protein